MQILMSNQKKNKTFFSKKKKKCKTNIFVGGGVCKDKQRQREQLFNSNQQLSKRTDGRRE
jgi:hypothetical protein